MRIIGNILWLILGGLLVSLGYFIAGLLYCVTIIGIPFGYQLWKFGVFSLWPFGTEVVDGDNAGGCLSIFMNVLWIRLVDGARLSGCRRAQLHHHHRHPFRSPALQDGSPLAHPIRQDLQKWLAAQGQRDSARVERPLPSAKPKKRLATQGQRDSAWVERPLPPASPLERGRLHSAEPASALKSCSPKLPDHNNPAMIYHNNPAMIERDLPSLELAERIK